MPTIGEMRRRVTLESRTQAPLGGAGGTLLDNVFATIATVWAQVITTKGTPRIDGVHIEDQPTHRFVIRRRTDIESDNYVKWDGRRFRIRDVEDVDEEHRFLDLLCEELRSGV